jgi:AraC family transcriptional regulator
MPQPSRIPRVDYSANDVAADSQIASNFAPAQCAQFAADVTWLERLRNTAVAENPDDHVIKSLSCALQAAEQENDQHCVDALRFAIAVRLLGPRSEIRTPLKPSQTEPRRRHVQALQKWRLKRVLEYVDRHLSAKITLAELAAVAGLSRMHFASQFREATNLRPHEMVLRRRVQRAEELLQNTTTPIVEIALTVGFQTQAHFTTIFKRFIGSTPNRWRAINQKPTAAEARNDKAVEMAAADRRRLASEHPSAQAWPDRNAAQHP